MFGVYLDRHAGAIMRASTYLGPEDQMILRATHCYPESWDSSLGPDTGQAGIEALVARVTREIRAIGTSKIKIAVSSPGPFYSLDHMRKPKGYGVINAEVANTPLKGLNLPDQIRRAYEKISDFDSNDLHIDVYTDAEACAIGEAVKRNTGRDSTLVFILVTEGIGLGIVRGRTPLGSALHSEFGMLPVRWDSKDSLRPNADDPKIRESLRLYSKSISQLADNEAIRTRKRIFSRDNNGQNLDAITLENLYNLRAYYLSQGCMACTVMLGPQMIVIGADGVDDDNENYTQDVAARTLVHFREFMEARKVDSQPVFVFSELNKDNYISVLDPAARVAGVPALHSTGALGLCHAAAVAKYRKPKREKPV